MKTLLTIFTLLFTVMFSSASFAEWTKVGENDLGDQIYFDLERIRKHDEYVYFWTMNDYLKPITDLKLLSAKKYQQVDCRSFGFKILSYVYHKESMGRDIGETAEPVNKNWRYPSPNSIIESILKQVCSQ